MNIYLDATTLIALGEVGELDLLTSFDGELCILVSVKDEVTTEPAKIALGRFINRNLNQNSVSVWSNSSTLFREVKQAKEEAERILDENEMNGDVAIVTEIVKRRKNGLTSAVISDDRRLRTVAEGLGGHATGTIGVVVRAVAEGGRTEQEAKALLRRLDSRGLHMTGELREKADELIEDVARNTRNSENED